MGVIEHGEPGGDLRDQTLSLRPQGARGRAGRSYFLVVQGDSSTLFHLPQNGTLLVGRGAEADLRIEAQAVSRRHARIILADGEVKVADLESHNGTRVNGELLTGARTLSSGDVVGIGDAVLVLHRARQAPGLASLEGAAFRRRLEEELARTVAFGRPLSLLVLKTDGSQRDHLARPLGEVLRVIDAVTWSGEGEAFVLLPEVSEAQGAGLAARLVEALAGVAPETRAGLASCPADGCDADALLVAARAAALLAAPGEVRDASEALCRLELGERALVVADPAMVRLYELIRRLASSDLPVLVCGETGVGKENAAFAVHFWSARAGKPFVTLNCAALQETLIESELFGYEKGAFTGATQSKAGLLEAGSGGTVFLDELGELSPSAQAKLLRALETHRLTRLGGVAEREIDIRVVAATNRNLEEEVQAGRFRRDLFFRLGAATVVLPPLRERPREIAVLAGAFLDDARTRAGLPPLVLAPATMQHLLHHAWPGNVRELKNVMEYLAATLDGEVVLPEHLPASLRRGEATPAPPPDAPPPANEPEAPPEAGAAFRPIAEEIRDLERARMAAALEAAGGVRSRAAALISMPLRTLVHKIKQYGLEAVGREPK